MRHPGGSSAKPPPLKVKEAMGTEPKQFVHYQDVLAHGPVDAVLISTPDHQHCTQLMAAMRARKDAYAEKPLAMDMKETRGGGGRGEGQRPGGAGGHAGAQLGAFTWRARAFVGLGRAGQGAQNRAIAEWLPAVLAPVRRRVPVQEADVDWRAFLMQRSYRPWDADQYAGWYGYREFSRGPHTGFMAHFTDLVHYVTGAKYPARVMAMGGTYRWKDKRTGAGFDRGGAGISRAGFSGAL